MTAVSDQQLAISLKEVAARARDLVNTSVQDMESGLWFYTTHEHLQVLYAGLMIVNRRKEKTKAKILKRRIKQLEKAGVQLL
jgi:uncharacterized membrane protein YfbV (UPF0208 family)